MGRVVKVGWVEVGAVARWTWVGDRLVLLRAKSGMEIELVVDFTAE
jgi:hypothetical protein